MSQLELAYSYCVHYDNEPKDIKLLKMHGSLNWLTCDRCNSINDVSMQYIGENIITNINMNHASIYQIFRNNKINCKLNECRGSLRNIPFIVPPTINKTEGHLNISSVWHAAVQELEEAENICIIGYSLPETDLFFRFFFALGTIGKTRIKKLWIVNDDDNEAALINRYNSIIGKGIESRARFIKRPFSYFVNSELRQLFK